ncbi:hypothetical protein FRB90_005959 [Tulasnella sp. 427]|nr:hypothetical protein FRB90_005959 [Tulasnella sp. 427]
MSTEQSLLSSELQSLAVFVLGATGYIGGSVLVGIQQRYPEFNYTALVRSSKNNSAIEAIGVKVIQGSHSDLELIEKVAAQHDIVVNCADADDLPLTIAILKGMMERSKRGSSSQKPLLIHTSGTSLLSEDNPTGSFIPGFAEKIYDDNKPEDIRGLGPKQPHRTIDLHAEVLRRIFAAGEAGLVDTYIVTPSTIYGKGQGPCRNRLTKSLVIVSQQVNGLIRQGVKRKQVVQIGPGTNGATAALQSHPLEANSLCLVWNNVHIEDLMDLYGLVLELGLSGDGPSDAYERFFFGSVGEHVWGEVAKELGKIMHQKGLVDTAEVKSISLQEEKSLLATATNSRSVANRGFALGWRPSRPSLIDTLPLEVEWTVEQLNDASKAPNAPRHYGMEDK